MPDATVIEALQRLAPAAATAEPAYAAVFRAIAELLLDRTTLYVAGRPHRFTELEMYWNGHAHPDPFTHGQPIQRQIGAWYFHRSGERYRGGTYKGLDITFGSSEAFGGILIRSVERVERVEPARARAAAPALIDGPCLVVDHILELTASRSIDELVGRLGGGPMIAPRDRRSPLHVELDDGPGRGQAIYATPRIGLTLKKGATEARQRYIARPYRFLTEPARIRKGKPHLVTALYQEGRSPDEIAALTGTRRSVVDGYIAAFEAGRARRTRQIDELRGDLSPRELCQLLGAAAAAPA
jgi:3-methyladenine DNA glycosylase Mpg